ncbi:MAG TPA: glycine betaine ABC transporter substrate-binding protein [Gaiellaceae bacterium]|jgi:glycine betaine/proline transport system substrate-binding protein|nr:glycine betaine ABC transporter substrate-binding protein [Gaiellaceae bacterium]
MKVRAGGLAVMAIAVAAVVGVGSAAAKHQAACGTVTLNQQAWAGSEANTYVAKNVLESIGCTVKISNIAEVPVYQAMADGKTDAVLEDWGHVPQQQQYVAKQKTVVAEGPNGVTGIIGWFIPTYLMKQHPEFKTWKGLKGKETLFKSPESGSQGMFLGGDPSYQQKDKTLITALHLNFKFVSVGAEPAQVARWTQLYKQGKPVIFYWYDPQYLNAQYKLSQVQLPPRFKGCQDDEKQGGNPAKYACSYPSYTLEKFFSAKFAKSGSPAVGVLKRFSWSNADQNSVAGAIAGKHVDPDKAAKAWIAANKAKVNKWLGK